MDLLTLMILNSFGLWLIVLTDQILQPPYVKTARIVTAIIVLVLLAVFAGVPHLVR